MKHVPLPDHGVGQVAVPVKLVLHHVVQHLQQEEDQVVVGLVGQQEPGGGEGLHQVHQLASCSHGHGLQIWRNITENS